MKDIIRKLGQYINNHNNLIVEFIYYNLCEIYYNK